MKIFFAFDTQPVQLKLVNWILNRTDLDKSNFMDEMKKEMDAKRKDSTAKTPIVDANNVFVDFQSEVKKWALKLGNFSNQFQECVYTRCGKEDEDFKYVFGDDKKPDMIGKSYQHKVNDIYDALKNALLFKEGKFKERAEKILEGFKKKNEKLETLVAENNKILADNNKNSGMDENDGRTLDQQEEDSWKHLEENCEELHEGAWHVYRVDEYEDLRNVAADCTGWCVARRDSGRGYFYGTYGPPYYLFCKGRRKPTILMHIESQQFKGVDDAKFEPDRPSSVEAIEIGRKMLDELGELHRFSDYEDFSIFNEEIELGNPVLDNANIISSASEDELLRMLDNTDSQTTINMIAKASCNYNVLMKAYGKLGAYKQKFWEAVVGKKHLSARIGEDNARRLYFMILDDCDEGDRKELLRLMMEHVDDDILVEVLEKYADNETVDDFIGSKYGRTTNGYSKPFIKYLIRNGMDAGVRNVLEGCRNSESMREIVEVYHDDEDKMIYMIDNNHQFANALPLIAKLTRNRMIQERLVKFVRNAYSPSISILLEIEKWLWKNIRERDLLQRMYDCMTFFKDKEVSDIMWQNAETVEQKCKALRCGASQEEIDRYFDEVIDNPDTMRNHYAREFFIVSVSRDMLPRLCEKMGYDFSIIEKRKDLPIDLKLEIVRRLPKVDSNQANTLLLGIFNKSTSSIADTDDNNRLMIEILKKNDEKIVTNCIGKYAESKMVRKYVIENSTVDTTIAVGIITKSPDIATDEAFRRIAEDAINFNNSSACVSLAMLDRCPNDLVIRMHRKFGNTHSMSQTFNVIEFKRGIKDDEEYVVEYCNDAYSMRTTASAMSGLVNSMKGDSARLSRIVGYIFGSDKLDKNRKTEIADRIVDAERECNAPAGCMSKCLEWCVANETNGEDVLRSPSATEEQIRSVLEWMYDYDIDAMLNEITPLAKKIVEELEENGDASIDWSKIVESKTATAKDLEKALDSISGDYENREFYEPLLKHPNCTQEIAEKAIEWMDMDDYFEDGCDLDAITKWIGSGILEMRDMRSSRGRHYIDSWEKLEQVAKGARNIDDLKKVIEYDQIEDDYYEDEHEHNFESVLLAVVYNENCTLDYFEEICKIFKSFDKKDLLRQYINGHKDMTAGDISRIIQEHDREIKSDHYCILPIFACPSITEEIVVGFVRKYNFFDEQRLLANPSLTEGMLLEIMEIVTDDETMDRIVKSPKAGEAVYEKALELFTGEKSVRRALDLVKNEEMKKKYTEKFDAMTRNSAIGGYWASNHPLADAINAETDDENLKRLVYRLCRRIVSGANVFTREECDEVRNQKALSMMAKQRDKSIAKCLIGNKNVSPSAVLSILKRNLSNETLSQASNSFDKDVLFYVCCNTRDERDINRILSSPERMRQFESDDIMDMIKMNPSLKFEILRRAYFKLSDDELRYLRSHLKDKDIDWIVDSVVGKDGEKEAKVEKIVGRMLRANIIVDRIASDYEE